MLSYLPNHGDKSIKEWVIEILFQLDLLIFGLIIQLLSFIYYNSDLLHPLLKFPPTFCFPLISTCKEHQAN